LVHVLLNLTGSPGGVPDLDFVEPPLEGPVIGRIADNPAKVEDWVCAGGWLEGHPTGNGTNLHAVLVNPQDAVAVYHGNVHPFIRIICNPNLVNVRSRAAIGVEYPDTVLAADHTTSNSPPAWTISEDIVTRGYVAMATHRGRPCGTHP